MLCLDFAPLKGSKLDELAAKWDIVLGYTLEARADPDEDILSGRSG
jgi:hypothetical protein